MKEEGEEEGERESRKDGRGRRDDEEGVGGENEKTLWEPFSIFHLN